MRADDYKALVFYKSVQAFKGVLKSAGAFHRKLRTDEQKEDEQNPEYENFHGYGI
jgi:hypothetical protein